jgi:flagella basal body P-ring formation protein FlgA
MKRTAQILIILAVTAWLAAFARASQTLVFAEHVMADAGRLTLLGLAAPDQNFSPELRQSLAAVIVGASPNLGRSLTIHGSRIKSLLKQANLGPEVSVLLPEQVVVERQSQVLTSQRLGQIYIEEVNQRLGQRAREADIRDLEAGRDLVLPAGRLTTQVRLIGVDGEPLGRVPAAVEVFVDGHKQAQARVSAVVDLYGQVVVAARPLMGRHVIGPDDVELRRVNLAELGGGHLSEPRDAVGLRTRTALVAGQALDLRRLEQAPLIHPGDVVTMIFNAEGLKVSAKGKAEQTGYAGGRIRLSNLSTKREVWGKVLDSGTVVVEF